MKKDLLQKSGKQPYSTPVVTAVEFTIENGFIGSNVGLENRGTGMDAWDHAPSSMSEGRSFGRNPWEN